MFGRNNIFFSSISTVYIYIRLKTVFLSKSALVSGKTEYWFLMLVKKLSKEMYCVS